MNYLRLYESFKLGKYETDYLKYDKLEREYMSKKEEVLRFEKELKSLDDTIKDDNKIDDMLSHIFDKLSTHYKYELGDNYDISSDSITEYFSSNLEQLFLDVNISYGDAEDSYYGTIQGIVNAKYDGWTVDLSDGSVHTFYELPSQVCYLLLQYVMNDNKVSGILNNEVFKKINK
tara:strand:- start:22071 stop:22595 length:525 start_codon:yes stop_codon:yes gene_type:complete